jgi:COMPASS component SWD2
VLLVLLPSVLPAPLLILLLVSWLTVLLQECNSRVNSIDFHRTHDLLVSAGDDDTLHVYDTAEGRHVASIPSNKYGCQNVVWTHAPDKIVFASHKV